MPSQTGFANVVAMQMINHHRLLNRMTAETQRQIACRQRKITLKRIFDSC